MRWPIQYTNKWTSTSSQGKIWARLVKRLSMSSSWLCYEKHHTEDDINPDKKTALFMQQAQGINDGVQNASLQYCVNRRMRWATKAMINSMTERTKPFSFNQRQHSLLAMQSLPHQCNDDNWPIFISLNFALSVSATEEFGLSPLIGACAYRICDCLNRQVLSNLIKTRMTR